MADKTPIRLVFTSGTPTGIAEYQTGETIGVEFGGTGVTTLTSNSILTGNGTSGIQSTALQISGTSISSSDSTSIQLNEAVDITGALTVGGSATITGNLTVNGTTTTVNSTAVEIQNAFIFEGATDDNFETTLTVVDPTADRSISLPNASGTIVLKDTTDTLTNKTINGPDNTLTNIANASLSNSDVTIGSTSISLGATSTTIAGLTSLTSTTLTDGTLTVTGGNITGAGSITGTGTITGGTITDGTASMSSGSLTSVVNVTGSGTANFTTDVQVNSVSVATRPFAIAQAVALG